MGGLRDRVCERKRKDLVQKQGEERWCKPLWFLHDEQEVDYGGGVQQSHVEVPAGHSEFYIFTINYNLTFQAGLMVIEADFKQEPDDDKPEPLEMEHFYFPLGLWLAGLVISVICLLAEIILNYIRKRPNRNVPMSTPDLEVEHNSNVDDIEDTEV